MSMINLSHANAIFTGGSYTQVNNNIQQKKSSWDLLQSAAAPSAFHDSGDTFDAPRCHPNTRVAIMSELRDFALRRGDTGHAKILWLNGAAGAGKSAIARSLCEECSSTKTLLASFFFNRSDASRNNHKSFVATITYQIYGSIPLHYQSLILGVIECDPLVFTRSIDAQVTALIVAPLHDLFTNGYFSSIGKRLIVVDGLDECSPTAAQINILTAIRKISTLVNIPFIFLIASRPENEFQSFFSSSSMVPLLCRLNLNDSYTADEDIERFLRDKLREICESHPFKDSIPSEWPSEKTIQILVDKSSGQFIYASLVVKFVTSNRHHPVKRLEVILNLRPAKGDLPFAELDGFYTQILSSAEGDIDLALRLIGYSNATSWLSIEDLAHISHLDLEDCLAAFCDLWSVLSLEHDGSGHQVRVLHKSFSDFLYDSTRSGKYHISETQAFIKLIGKCLLYISEVTYTPECSHVHNGAVGFLESSGLSNKLISNISLIHHDLMSFSVVNCYKIFASPTSCSKEEMEQFYITLWDFFFGILLEQLRTLVGTDYGYLYDHHFGEFQNLITQHPDIYTTLFTHPELDFHLTDTTTIMTGLILTEQFGSEAPLKIFTLARFDFLTKGHDGSLWDSGWFYQQSKIQLLHDAAIKCFSFLKHDANPLSIAATLRYLSWALCRAAYSSELDEACRTCTKDLLSNVSKGYNSGALANVVEDVLSIMGAYIYDYPKDHNDTSNVNTAETGFTNDGD